jgi:hypothetical protein
MDMARKNGQGSKWIRRSTRLAIYLRDGFTCQARASRECLGDLRNAKPEEMGLDHLVCSINGGSNAATNLVTICRVCNSSRGVQDWETWYPASSQERIRMLLATPLNRAMARELISGGKWVDTEGED